MTALERAVDAVKAQRLWIAGDGVSVFPDDVLARQIARAALLAIRESEPTAWVCVTDVGKGRSHIVRNVTEDKEVAEQCAKLSYWSVTPLHDIDAILNETPE